MSFNKKKSRLLEDNDEEEAFNETFVTYGTELPDINTSGEQDKGKFQPIWKQEVSIGPFNKSFALLLLT
jgi:hypothetical protein